MSSRFPKTISLLAAAAALAVPAAASASSVTYIDGGNVHVASPDGRLKKQLSTDGTTTHPYMLPSMADDGEVTSIRGGNTSSKVITVFNAAGGRIDNVMPWKISTGVNIGPNGARVNPTGGQIAYTYYLNHGPYSGYPNGGFESRLAIVTRRQPGLPTNPMVDQGGGWEEPTWIDNKLVVAKGGALHLEMEPLKFTQFLAFNPPNPAEPDKRLEILRGEVSRAKHRYLVQARDWNNVQGLFLAAHSGEFPGGTVPTGCWVPIGSNLDYAWGLSPDGTQVTWADANGVHVGTFTPENQQGTVCQGNVVTLSATGKEPAFGMWDMPEPVQEQPAPQPQPQPQPAPTPAPAAKPVVTQQVKRSTTGPGAEAPVTGSPVLELSAPATAATTSVSSGSALRVSASAPKPGTLSAKLVAKGKTLGSARMTVSKAGRYQLKLKLTKAGKKAVKRLKGKKVSLQVTFVPKGGGAKLVSTAKVSLR